MRVPQAGFFRRAVDRYARKRPPEDAIAEAADPSRSLKKTLNAFDLTVLGVGAIIGAGIFALAGRGAQVAGPAIIWSFVLVGFVCALAGLAYAEMAAAIPTSGSAYAYTYSAVGETMAWTVGWALVLEYAVGAATVSIAWSGNFVGFMKSVFDVDLPARLTTSIAVDPQNGFVNLPAVLIVLAVTVILVIGVKESAWLTTAFVLTKVAILLFIVAVGFFYIEGGNLGLDPPAAKGDWYDVLGAVGPVLAGGAIIFFAYIGFDAVSTTAEETKRPKRDLPIGILGSLAICTVLYIVASTVLLGLVPYTSFSEGPDVTAAESEQRLQEAFAYGFSSRGVEWAANIVRVGALIGITSVLLVLLLGGPRIFFALSRDGLLPASWSRVHPRFGTPHLTTIGTAVGVSLFAGFGTLGAAANFTNIGTLYAFILVCLGVILLRYRRPDLARPFRVPLNIGRFPVPAGLGVVMCTALAFSLELVTLWAFLCWMGAGLVLYSLFGIRKSKLFGHVGRTPEGPPPTRTRRPEPDPDVT